MRRGNAPEKSDDETTLGIKCYSNDGSGLRVYEHLVVWRNLQVNFYLSICIYIFLLFYVNLHFYTEFLHKMKLSIWKQRSLITTIHGIHLLHKELKVYHRRLLYTSSREIKMAPVTKTKPEPPILLEPRMEDKHQDELNLETDYGGHCVFVKRGREGKKITLNLIITIDCLGEWSCWVSFSSPVVKKTEGERKENGIKTPSD